MRGRPDKNEIAVIKSLLRTGKYNARQIAEVMERTRGSIIGIIWRTPELNAIGLPQSRRNPHKKQTEEDRTLLKLKQEQDVQEARDLIYGARLLAGPKTLKQLASWHCRFPMWGNDEIPTEESLFCAEAKVADSSYCEFHRKICVAPPHRRVA